MKQACTWPLNMADVNKKISVNSDESFFKFSEEIETEFKNDFRRIRIFNEPINEEIIQEKYDELINWLQETPRNCIIRTNTLLTNSNELIEILENSSDELKKSRDHEFTKFSAIPELIVASRKNIRLNSKVLVQCEEAIVDAACGSAVLRGAHVFAPGVMGLTSGARVGEIISVFADTSGTCKKGLIKKFENSKKLLGNGILVQHRKSIFLDGKSGSGIAIRMLEIVSDILQLSEEIIPEGFGLFQNIPSIICTRILDPKPGEIILDLCAAPGNKTTHISALMMNKGTIIALEKVKSKIEKLKTRCDNFGCKNVRVFCFDSTKSAEVSGNNRNIEDGPPFSIESFDKILLDGPCSVLGKRPQIFNKISAKELRSFIPLQRKLFSAAVQLLKIGGHLVYSTCTITISENEGIVAWALKSFPCLELISAKEKYETFDLGKFSVSSGYSIDNLSHEDAAKVLRFGPGSECVGFFIAYFRKREILLN